MLPYEIYKLFEEFKSTKNECKYKNCLHIDEEGCRFGNINIVPSRFESYKKFVSEAREYEAKISKLSIKSESKFKYNKNKIMTKISIKKRNQSRKTIKQNLQKEDE